ncbi:MAG: AAA family ATPase, partial [Candidatus Nomurabacteria bacterium]|nr:AAA family ATPase [Candidatus Nomurabacteria bacterium]
MNTSNNLPNLIGLGGTFASGKDSLANFLVEKFGFTNVSTGDMVRVAARERYGDIERPTLKKVGAELRNELGAGALVLRGLQEPRPLIISGIRAIGEVE